MQLCNPRAVDDCWASFERSLGIWGSPVIRKIMPCKLWHQFHRHLHIDFNACLEVMNDVLHQYWIVSPVVDVDDRLNHFKGRDKHKIYRKRKPKPWGMPTLIKLTLNFVSGMLEYGGCDGSKACYVFAVYPRYGDFSPTTTKYDKWRELFKIYLENPKQNVHPLPWKKFAGSNSSRTTFDLPLAIKELLKALATTPKFKEYGKYVLIMDSEFGTNGMLEMLESEFKSLPYIIGVPGNKIQTIVSGANLSPLQYGQWSIACSLIRMVISF
jgi:hypothetical protein